MFMGILKSDSTDKITVRNESIKTRSLILFQEMGGIFLPNPHAKWIWEGKKTMIVKSKDYSDMVDKALYLIDRDYCYGVIRLHPSFKTDLKGFDERRNYHLVSDGEAKKWWGNQKEFHIYSFDLITKFEEAKSISISKSTQTFVKDIKFLAERELELIADIEKYDPEKTEASQLKDDWRIVLAWYSSKKEGKEIKHSLESIINLAKGIYDELKKRKIEFHPETYAPNALEIYKKVAKKDLIFTDLGMPNFLNSFENATIIKDFISIVGSTAEGRANKDSDIDLLVRLSKPTEYLKRAIQVRLLKSIPENINKKIHFIFGDPEGAHDTYIPLYDLTLLRTKPEVVEMAEKTLAFNPMNSFLPTKTTAETFFEMDKLVDFLFKD